MVDEPFEINEFYKAWLSGQTQLLEAQQVFWNQMSSAKAASPADDPGTAQATLQKMMDPGQFLFAGSDEVNQTIQRLAEGASLADIGTLERQTLRSTKEWLTLREASAEYRSVAAQGWAKAAVRFSESLAKNPEIAKAGPRAVLDHWLQIANDEVTALQRTDAFLKAQRKLLRAGVDYRLCERQLMEEWCEQHSMPTRTEIDDLHATVHRLRREMRDLKKQVAGFGRPLPKRAIKQG